MRVHIQAYRNAKKVDRIEGFGVYLRSPFLAPLPPSPTLFARFHPKTRQNGPVGQQTAL